MIDDIVKIKMEDISNTAYIFFEKYDLNDWSFRFDHAKSRVGLCIYNKKIISLSLHFVKVATSEDIRNALLHEIAHALVGHCHGHDSVWKAKALEIGCNARRCYEKPFFTPKWIMFCPNGCFKISRQRKNKKLICKSCKVSVNYVLNNV